MVDDGDANSNDLGCSVLCVWGESRDNLWFAGGSLGVGDVGACALHFDGVTWTRLPVDFDSSFWWVTELPSGNVWFVGEDGIAVLWDGENTVQYDTGVQATLFGVWGASDDDVWAVGGSSGIELDVIVHFDGTAWSVVAPPEPRGVPYFKVWGSAADDVWIVGHGGLILHYDGGAWSIHTEWTGEFGNGPRLFTVHGRSADDVWAVGSSITILHFDGTE